MRVRPATAADAGSVAAVLLAAFREFEPLYTPGGFRATTLSADEIRARLPDGPTWLAFNDVQRPVGTVACIDRGHEVFLRSMAVIPEVQGNGVERLLLDTVLDFATSRGIDRVALTTTPFLTAAIALYESAGFVRQSGQLDLKGTPLFAMTLERR